MKSSIKILKSTSFYKELIGIMGWVQSYLKGSKSSSVSLVHMCRSLIGGRSCKVYRFIVNGACFEGCLVVHKPAYLLVHQ